MKEGTIHIYTTQHQRATRYRCDAGFIIKFKPRKLLYAICCYKRRWAKYLNVQSYYDGDRFSCKNGYGCKARKK